jgi:hypothetical protein
MQSGEYLTTETWCERWNMKIDEDKTQAFYFSHTLRPREAHPTLNGWNIPFISRVKHLGVIFDKRITWRLHIDMIEAKAFRTFIRIYSLFKNESSSANIKLTLHRALIRSIMTYACPAWLLAADTYLLKLQLLQNSSPHHWKFSRVHTGPRFAHGFQPSMSIRLQNCEGTKQKSYKIMRMNMFAA